MNMGDFSDLAKMILEAEKEEELKRENIAEKEHDYFLKKLRESLQQKDIKDMSWTDLHNLNELRKDDSTGSNTGKSPEELYTNILDELDGCMAQCKADPEYRAYIPKFQNIQNMIMKMAKENGRDAIQKFQKKR